MIAPPVATGGFFDTEDIRARAGAPPQDGTRSESGGSGRSTASARPAAGPGLPPGA